MPCKSGLNQSSMEKVESKQEPFAKSIRFADKWKIKKVVYSSNESHSKIVIIREVQFTIFEIETQKQS